MTYSTYLRTAAARASIQIETAPCMVGSLAEYKANWVSRLGGKNEWQA